MIAAARTKGRMINVRFNMVREVLPEQSVMVRANMQDQRASDQKITAVLLYCVILNTDDVS